MDYKRYNTYFRQSELFRLSGIVLLVVGLFLMTLAWSFRGNTYVLFVISAALIVVGFVLFLITSAQNVSENEIKEETGKALAEIEADIYSDPEIAGKMMPGFEPISMEGALYLPDANLFRRGKNSTVLSNVYMKTYLYFTREYLIIRAKKVNLTEDKSEVFRHRIPWENVKQTVLTPLADRVTLSNAKNTTAPVHGMYLDFLAQDDSLLFRTPIHDDMDAEELRNRINKICAAYAPKNQ